MKRLSMYSSFTVCIHRRREHTVQRLRVMRWGRVPFLPFASQPLESVFPFFFSISKTIQHNTSQTDCQLSLTAPVRVKHHNYCVHYRGTSNQIYNRHFIFKNKKSKEVQKKFFSMEKMIIVVIKHESPGTDCG